MKMLGDNPAILPEAAGADLTRVRDAALRKVREAVAAGNGKILLTQEERLVIARALEDECFREGQP
jgi:hypothetical protein